MADKKISQLDSVNMGTLNGSELFVMVQGGVTVSVTLAELYTIFSGGGGLPMGNAYQVLQLDGSNNPAFVNTLSDESGSASIDFFNRIISASGGGTVFDYQNRYIYNTYESIVFDIDNQIIGDVSGINSLDANNRYLCNQYGSEVLQYQNFFIDTNAIAGHAGYSPSISYTLNAGAGASVSHATGSNNLSGKITLNTGTGVGTGPYINFSNNEAFPSDSFVTLTPANQLTAALYGTQQVSVTGNNSLWAIDSGSVPLADSSTYAWYYHVIGG